jgi:predicted S18 family serine protease
MKKILALLLLIITLSIGVNAQDTVRVKNQVFEILSIVIYI